MEMNEKTLLKHDTCPECGDCDPVIDGLLGLAVGDAFGVPVEFMVATIFCAMMALLPTPVMTIRPFEAKIASTQASKSPSIKSIILRIASASVLSTFLALFLIFFINFNFTVVNY